MRRSLGYLTILPLLFACAKPISAPSTLGTVEDCPPTSGPIDLITSPSRGAYLTDYAGSSLSEVHFFLAAGTAGNFTLTLKARAGAFDGSILGTATATVDLTALGTATEVTFAFSPPLVVPETAGHKTVTFELIKDSGAGAVYGSSVTQSASCTLIQTNGITAPLDSQNGSKVWAVILLGN